MANKKIGLGMLVMALIFGMTLTGCPGSGGDDPVFTLTDIPSGHIGKFISFSAAQGSDEIYGWKSFVEGGDFSGVEITGGSVNIPVWREVETQTFERYSGSSNADLDFYLMTTDGDTNNGATAYKLDGVSFSNGFATKSFNDLVEQE